jgi:hypothetical protein
MRPTIMLTGLALLSACGTSLLGKDDDSGGTGVVGPGSCQIDSTEDDSSMCLTFSGIAWMVGTAEEYCESKSEGAVQVDWRDDQGCAGGYDGLCEVTGIPAFEHEVYIYGEGAEAAKELCGLLGGDWSE